MLERLATFKTIADAPKPVADAPVLAAGIAAAA
jgi:hypothetical protein